MFIQATPEQIWDAITKPEFTAKYFFGSKVDPELAAEPPSRVTWEIEPQPGGVTKLTVIHDQLEDSPKTSDHVAGGWMFIISGLKTLLETGKPLTARSAGDD